MRPQVFTHRENVCKKSARSRSRSIAATMAQTRSGVKIAAQRDPPPQDQPQSGLAHAVQFFVRYVRQRSKNTYMLVPEKGDGFCA